MKRDTEKQVVRAAMLWYWHLPKNVDTELWGEGVKGIFFACAAHAKQSRAKRRGK